MKKLQIALGMAVAMAVVLPALARAQVPADIAAGLKKIGQIVDPACTAKLYRPLMPANDVNSKATPLYKGIDIARDVSFGPNARDVVDIFTADKRGDSRPVLIYVPGGAGNKIEQQGRKPTRSTTTSCGGRRKTGWSASTCSAIPARATGTMAARTCR